MRINSQNTGLAIQQRQSVKTIASSLQGDLDTYQRIPLITTNAEKLDCLRRRLLTKNQQLAALRAGNLECEAPAPSVARTLKSGTALSGAIAARAGAIVAATATGAVQAGVMAAALPVLGVLSGALNGFSNGWSAPVACAKPVTAVAGMGIGAVSGGIAGTFSMAVAIPVSIGLKGSIPRKAFNFIDQMPKARAYAKRKKQSTWEIADTANNDLAKLLRIVEQKHEEAQFFASAPEMMRDMATALGQAVVEGNAARF